MRLLPFVVGLLLLGGCGGKAPAPKKLPPPPSQAAPQKAAPQKPKGGIATANLQNGKKIFETTCAPCHGIEGKGNGPAAGGLNPKPRNFTDAAVMEKLSDEHIFKTIREGGGAVGKSPLMPAQPQLSDPEIWDLVAYVRTFAQKK